MPNLLRDMFDPNSDYNKEQDKMLEEMQQQAKEDKCCRYCTHAELQPHYEHGKYGGTDPFCPIFGELILEYGHGQQCIFWEEKK